MTDVMVERLETTILVHPTTTRGRDWVEANAKVPSSAWLAGTLALEPIEAADLLKGMAAAGLVVEDTTTRDQMETLGGDRTPGARQDGE